MTAKPTIADRVDLDQTRPAVGSDGARIVKPVRHPGAPMSETVTELKPCAWFFRWPGSTSWRNSDVDPTGRIPNEQFATVLCAYDHEDIAAALSAAEARGRDAAWQTIDSAPKDGTRVWLYQQRGYGHEQFVGWFERTADGWYWQDEGDTEPEPTHWQRLPPPPSAKD